MAQAIKNATSVDSHQQTMKSSYPKNGLTEMKLFHDIEKGLQFAIVTVQKLIKKKKAVGKEEDNERYVGICG